MLMLLLDLLLLSLDLLLLLLVLQTELCQVLLSPFQCMTRQITSSHSSEYQRHHWWRNPSLQ